MKLSKLEMKRFFVLLGLCMVAGVLVLPYALKLNPQAPPFDRALLQALVNGSINYSFMIYFGLLMQRRVPTAGLLLFERDRKFPSRDFFYQSALAGLTGAVLIVALDFAFKPWLPELAKLAGDLPGPLYGFMASFYGGLVEEVMLRLFLMSFLLLILKRLGSIGIWMAILMATILFGVGHLPALAQALGLSGMGELSELLILRTLLLNGVVGLICGWFFWKKGFEYAVLTHFFADIGLHVITPLVT